MKAELGRPTDVAKNPFDKRQMTLFGAMHVKVGLLYSVGDVGSSDGEILKPTSDASVFTGITHSSPGRGRQLGLDVDGCSSGLTIRHASPVEEILGVLGLRQKETVRSPANIDAEEEAKRAHVFDGELGAETRDDVLEQSFRRCAQHHIIDV